jgi:hypothetical protein
MPIRRLNNSECELVEPQLPKPISSRICRRNCIEWRIGNWAEVKILINIDTNYTRVGIGNDRNSPTDTSSVTYPEIWRCEQISPRRCGRFPVEMRIPRAHIHISRRRHRITREICVRISKLRDI